MVLHGQGYNNFENPSVSGEHKFIKLLSAINPTLCVDVGANKGNYARSLLEKTNAKVISFEPLPKAFKALEELKKQYADRFECINMGVANQPGVLKLHYGAEDSEHASFSSEINSIEYVGQHNKNTMDVKVVTLDDYFRNNPTQEISLLKIDTEGFEYEVLQGAAETIKNNSPKFVQIEFNHHQLFRGQSLFSIGKLLPGYRVYQLLPYGKGLALRDMSQAQSNFYFFSNFVFVHPDIKI